MPHPFHALGVSAPLCDALAAGGISEPFAVQTLVLPDALLGVDILAESPTGSGKTLAFGLPVIERTAGAQRRPAALVLVPTRELALQVAADLRPLARAKRLRVATVYGGVALPPQAKQASQADVLVATPGRLNDLIERRLISLATSASSCSTRPTGCSTWDSAPRSTGSCAPSRRTGRPCSSRPRSMAPSPTSPARTP